MSKVHDSYRTIPCPNTEPTQIYGEEKLIKPLCNFLSARVLMTLTIECDKYIVISAYTWHKLFSMFKR